MFKLKVIFITIIMLSISFAAIAQEKSNTEMGKELVEKAWVDMKQGNVEALDKMMSPAFQSIHQDGARNKKEELALISKLNLGDYKLTNFKVSFDGAVLLASYFVTVTETIDGKQLDKTPAPRLSVFVKKDNNWLWIAHANLKPLKK
ncbi:nuclear transport factor 2 family protein [bacterium]|nr:nuclear transport factor 2 family protein [bacterium]